MAKAYGYIANLEMAEGHLAAAEENFGRALAVREKQLGQDHPKTATSLAAVGSVHLARGEFEEAREYLQRAVAINERTLGVEHPSSVSALRAWGDLLWATGRIADAVEVQRRANNARERELLRNLTAGSEQRKMSYLDLTAGELDRTISLHQVAARSNPTAASVALEIILRRKGRALDAMTGQIESLRRRSSLADQELLATQPMPGRNSPEALSRFRTRRTTPNTGPGWRSCNGR
ncbi:MAG: tetratricopeptide repeat protein [Blastocatellia bacterium]|nr:tetratricopeptide repeat protein [Blastocatellia bacterium]